MNKIIKLLDQMRVELESTSLHYDMDEILDLFGEFEAAVTDFAETHEDDD